MGIRCADHVTPLCPKKLALTSPTGGGRSVGIVRSRIKATEREREREMELNDLYSVPNIVRVIKSRRMRWEGQVVRMGQCRDLYRVLVGKREGKRPLGRPRLRWEDNIKMDLQEVGCGVLTGSSWLRIGTGGGCFVNAVMNIRVSIKCGEFLD